MNDRTIEPATYEFSIGGTTDKPTHVGLHCVQADGSRATIAVDIRDAEVVGRMLIAHADALTGKPVRNW